MSDSNTNMCVNCFSLLVFCIILNVLAVSGGLGARGRRGHPCGFVPRAPRWLNPALQGGMGGGNSATYDTWRVVYRA